MKKMHNISDIIHNINIYNKQHMEKIKLTILLKMVSSYEKCDLILSYQMRNLDLLI